MNPRTIIRRDNEMFFEEVNVSGYYVVVDGQVYKNPLKLVLGYNDDSKFSLMTDWKACFRMEPDRFTLWYVDSDSKIHCMRNSASILRIVRAM